MTFYTAKTAFFTLLITLLSVTQIFAQSNGNISGTLNDATSNEPLAFATVALLQKGSIQPVTSKQTDINGKFTFSGIANGNYTVRATYVGYLTINTDVAISAAKSAVVLGSIKLTAAKGVLKQVEVSAQKSEIKLGIDKKSFDVSQSLVSQGGSATDLLANVPSVQVDVDGNVSLRGSAVKFLINGKPSTLTGSSLTDILQSIPASSIETIEVITNPSSKYDAEGQSGLINIVLKKNVATGFTGSASGTVGTQHTYNGTLNLAYNTGKINIYGNYSYRKADRVGNGTITKQITEPGLVANTNQASNQEFDFGGHNIRSGIDYNLDNNNTISFSDNINIRDRTIFQNGNTITTRNGAFYDSQNQNNVNTGTGTNLDFNLDFDHKFKKKGEEWTAAVGYSRDKNNSVANLFTDTTNASNAIAPPPVASIANTYGLEQNWNLQTDYTLPLKDGRFEIGYRGTFNNNDVDYITNSYQTFTTPPSYLYNASLSDDFLYKLNIQAAYANFQHQFGKFGVQAGLRMEDTHVNTELTTNGVFTPNKQYYTRLYPTLFLTEKLTDNETIQLSYSRRVARPQQRQLSPFLDQSNTQNYQQGNPNLLPEDTHSFELSYINYWSGVTLTSSLYYRLTHDVIQQITTFYDPNNIGINLSTFENIKSASNAGYELIAKISPSNIVDLTLNGNAYYRTISADPTYNILSSHGFSYTANLTGSIKATKQLSVQLRADYQGKQVSAQGTNLAMYGLDGGVKYDLSKVVSLSLNSRDIFNTRKFRSISNITSTTSSGVIVSEIDNSDRRFATRTVMFTATWRFGRGGLQTKKGQKGQGDNPDNMGGGDDPNGGGDGGAKKDNGVGGTIGNPNGKGTTTPPATAQPQKTKEQ